MAATFHSCDHADEEDYIDMEVSSNPRFFLRQSSITSPPRHGEFEFQMFSSSSENDTTTSPADELFYKGKLLPLHLPPRLQMVEILLQKSAPHDKNKEAALDDFFSTPLNATPTSNTPFESCNISPSDSCQVSRELNPGKYFSEYLNSDEIPKTSWTRKLKLIKQSSLSSKLKASRAYLRSFFSKSGCSAEVSVPQDKTTFGQIEKDGYRISDSNSIMRGFGKEKISESGSGRHRRSFSGAIKRFSMPISSSSCSSSSSSSSSSNSNGCQESRFLKRIGSANSEIENSIQAAIAHCKRSQQQIQSRKTVSDIGICSLSASRIVYEDQERPGICSG